MNVCMTILNNVAVYMDYLPLELQQSQWALVIQELEALFRKLEPLMNKVYDYTCLFMIMGTLFKVSSISSNKVYSHLPLVPLIRPIFYFVVARILFQFSIDEYRIRSLTGCACSAKNQRIIFL